jgi:hypothetical protein
VTFAALAPSSSSLRAHRHEHARDVPCSGLGGSQPTLCGPSEVSSSLAARQGLAGFGSALALSPFLKVIVCVAEGILNSFPTESELHNTTTPVIPFPGFTVPTSVPPAQQLPTLDYKMLSINSQLLAANARAQHLPVSMPGLTYVTLLGGRAALFTLDGASPGRTIYVLSIVGTQTGADALADLAYLPVRFNLLFPGRGTVHGGFDAVAQKVFKDFEPYVANASLLDEFIVSGYSLGGKLTGSKDLSCFQQGLLLIASAAVICAARAQEKYPLKKIHLLTTATPRTGDGDFMNYLNNIIPNVTMCLTTCKNALILTFFVAVAHFQSERCCAHSTTCCDANRYCELHAFLCF